MIAGVSLDHHQIDQCHGPLRDAGADGRARDGQLQSVDQDQVEGDIQRKACRGHGQRGAGVLQAPKHSGAGEDEQHGHKPRHGPAQVVHGELTDFA